MPPPKVSYSELDEAFQFASFERHYWLDKQTGRILAYGDEAAQALQEGHISELPGWMNDQIEAAREVLGAFGELPEEVSQSQASVQPTADDQPDYPPPLVDTSSSEKRTCDSSLEPSRYVSIEQVDSHEAFQFMADFIDELSNARIREALSRALAGNKPFRRFKDALAGFPAELERWFEYESKRRREYIEEWAGDHGVELDFGDDAR